MRRQSLFLLAATVITVLLLIVLAPASHWAQALLGFQLPALWTVLALVGIMRAVRKAGAEAVPLALYLALGITLVNYFYFAVEFSAVRAGH